MTLIQVADSWEEPTDAQFAAAKAAGISAWLGYFKETSTDNIFHGWADATFQRAKAAGILTGDYCSQLDDPTWVRSRAASLGIIAILDDESRIDPDNSGTDAWLTTAGAHLYGGSGVQAAHRTHGHTGYVFSEYPTGGNPTGTNWPPGFAQPTPPRPMGWQYSDKGSVGGITVDLSVFDSALFGAPAPIKEDDMGQLVVAAVVNPNGVKADNAWYLFWLGDNPWKKWFDAVSGDAADEFPGPAGVTTMPTVSATWASSIPTIGPEAPGYPASPAFQGNSGGAGAPFASAIAGTIEDQGGGKSSLTGTATPA